MNAGGSAEVIAPLELRLNQQNELLKKCELFKKTISEIWGENISIKEASIRIQGNEFLYKFNSSEFFRKQTIDKFKRLYNACKSDVNQSKLLLENIQKLLYNTWDGAYSEITAYDFINLCFKNPCKIQIDDLKRENTLAKYCIDKQVSSIDGFIKDALVFFEVKTMTIRVHNLMDKLKRELQCLDRDNNNENYFVITSDYPNKLNLKDDDYAKLKQEIIASKNKKETFLFSKIIQGLHLKFHYKPQGVLIEFHDCESSYESAERLERLPLQDYHQFVDGRFMKIFICNGLNNRNSIICNRDFFRALSRRVFCKLTKDDTKFDNNSELKTSDIAKKLSALMFIIDLSANLNEDKNIKAPIELYKVFLYANPNTDWNHSLVSFQNFVHVLNHVGMADMDIDDFEHDNY